MPPARLERATPGLGILCSIHLSYGGSAGHRGGFGAASQTTSSPRGACLETLPILFHGLRALEANAGHAASLGGYALERFGCDRHLEAPAVRRIGIRRHRTLVGRGTERAAGGIDVGWGRNRHPGR